MTYHAGAHHGAGLFMQGVFFLKSLSIRNQKDFAAGALYIVVGLAFAIGATNYNLGTAARMGPGYFPFWLGLFLATVGAVVLVRSVRAGADRQAMPRFDFKTLAWLLGAVALFGALLKPLGLVASLLVLILVSSVASHEFGWKGALLTAVLLIAACLGIFIYGLNMQMPLWPALLVD
jgi:hypothetical protein